MRQRLLNLLRRWAPNRLAYTMLVAVSGSGLVSACVCNEDITGMTLLESQPGQSLTKVNDPHIVKNYRKEPFLNDGEYAIRWYPNSIEIVTFAGLDIPELRNTMTKYQKTDSSQDAIAKAFIQSAKSRGNRVKLYDAKANKAIIGCVKQRVAMHTLVRADIDPTLVEFDRHGNMVAALVRMHRMEQNMVTKNHFIVSKIYLGALAKSIDTQLDGLKRLDNQLIRTI